MPRYERQRDAEMRLNGTVLSYDGKAIKVMGVDDELRLYSVFIRSGEEKIINQDDPRLSFIPPTLGYINTETEALFSMRVPARRYKQGLDIRTVYFSPRNRDVRRHQERFFVDCLENIYPTIEQCMRKLGGGTNPFKQDVCRSVAFSKKFAIGSGVGFSTLLHKGREVGHFEGTIPVLSDRFSYLQECLDEAMS